MLDLITMVLTKAVITLESYWNPAWQTTITPNAGKNACDLKKKPHSILLNKNFQCGFHFFNLVVILFHCILVILSLNFF